MTFETFVRNSFGEFTSVGCADVESTEMVKFFSAPDGTEPRYCVGSVLRTGELVQVTREILLSRVEIERNDCLFTSEEEAKLFESQMRILITPRSS